MSGYADEALREKERLDEEAYANEEDDEDDEDEEEDFVAELPSAFGKDSKQRLVSSSPKLPRSSMKQGQYRLLASSPKLPRSSVQDLGSAKQFNPRMSILAEGDEDENEDDENQNDQEDEKCSISRSLDAKAHLAGWLSKRGPMFGYGWTQRWCVLESTGITYYSDEQCSTKKGDVLIGGSTQAIAFRDSTVGETVKHILEKPLGFVIDIDPSKGRSRKLHYFDAGSEDVLREWTEAIGQVARKFLALEVFPSEVGHGKFAAKGSSNANAP